MRFLAAFLGAIGLASNGSVNDLANEQHDERFMVLRVLNRVEQVDSPCRVIDRCHVIDHSNTIMLVKIF